MVKLSPSRYQQNIIAFGNERIIEDGQVNAVAGSGKSSTLFMFLKEVSPRSAVMIAFNKPIATENGIKLKEMKIKCWSKTVHSIGYGMLAQNMSQRPNVDNRKYRDLVYEYINSLNMDRVQANEARSNLYDLSNLARLNLIQPDDEDGLRKIMEHHQIVGNGYLFDGMKYVVEKGNLEAERLGKVDFTDMLWLPVIWGYETYRNEWVLVDEAQDLSAAQLAITMKCKVENFGRMLFVGDERQAIYGFAGADAESFRRIQEVTGARQLPLSICYRCPVSHVKLAQGIVPQIEWREGAPDGIVGRVKQQNLHNHLKSGDLILCRLTAPLVRECIALIKRRVPAKVKGRDIGKQLTDIVESVSKMAGYTWSAFGSYLEAYRREKENYLMQKEVSENVLQAFYDKIDAVDVCAEEFQATSERDLIAQIENLFADEASTIFLSTVHRAKGLEADRVFILEPDLLPFSWKGQLEWQAVQERNLQYVAYTRSKGELYFVDKV